MLLGLDEGSVATQSAVRCSVVARELPRVVAAPLIAVGPLAEGLAGGRHDSNHGAMLAKVTYNCILLRGVVEVYARRDLTRVWVRLRVEPGEGCKQGWV